MNRVSLNLPKIPKKTLRQTIYEELKNRIIFAEILPGQLMTLNGLAIEFGVSLMPVREALWQLESEKIVVIESNKSIHVSTLTAAEMEEALELRLMLEAKAAERSCERITDRDVSKIKHILDSMENSLEEPARYMRQNRRFHLGVYSCADSPMLLQFIHSIWARITPYTNILTRRFGDLSASRECHRGMYAALVKKDQVKLKKWLCQDLEAAAAVVIAHFDEAFPKP